MAVVDYFNLLLGGDLFGVVIRVFTDLLGGWFWVWMFGMGLLLIYNKSDNYGTVGIVALVIAGHMFPLFPPVVHLIAYALLALGITVILYRVYH